MVRTRVGVLQKKKLQKEKALTNLDRMRIKVKPAYKEEKSEPKQNIKSQESRKKRLGTTERKNGNQEQEENSNYGR